MNVFAAGSVVFTLAAMFFYVLPIMEERVDRETPSATTATRRRS